MSIWSDDPVPDGARRVIVGVSGSLGNRAALRAAAGQASERGAPLVAVLAWTPVGGETAYLRDPLSPLLRTWESQARDRLMSALAEVVGPRRAPDCWPVVARGEPAWTLTQLARSDDDVLVVGAGRDPHGALRWRGSIARRCLALATCPVLTVPPPDLVRELRRARTAARSIRMRGFA